MIWMPRESSESRAFLFVLDVTPAEAPRCRGMKTYYTKRPTEDLEDPIDADEARRRGFDGFFEADGLMALADELGC